jgi:GDPmannose 4,6-dehydratase
MKRSLITGITGQDGSYLAELLLQKGYEVHGIVKQESLEDSDHKLRNIKHLKDTLVLHEGSLTDHLRIYKIFAKIQPDECYHLAASSYVDYSLDDEKIIMSVNFTGTSHIISTIAEVCSGCRLFFAGSSEMFGEPASAPQDEETAFNPKSIYGISKVASHFLIKNYRECRGIFACTGIMYNHESPHRGHQFVTRKITSTVCRIKHGLEQKLTLGNLDVMRDWGYAPDYVKAMWLMLQADSPKDYIIATGKLHSVRQLLEVAFSHLGLDYRDYVKTDPLFFRPAEKVPLVGNPERIRRDLGWQSTKSIEEVITEMVDNDLQL